MISYTPNNSGGMTIRGKTAFGEFVVEWDANDQLVFQEHKKTKSDQSYNTLVGSTLHNLLSFIGLHEKIDPLSGKATCSCQSLMAEMDRLGPDEVEKRADEFVAHMLKNAEQYSWLEKAKAGIAAITKYPELAGIFAADGLAGVLRFFVAEAIKISRETGQEKRETAGA